MRKEILRQITEIEMNHCKPCESRINNTSTRINAICAECTHGMDLRRLGNQLVSEPFLQRHKWTKAQKEYVLGHIKTLGLERGTKQSAKKLGIDERLVEQFYFNSKKVAHYEQRDLSMSI
ncbi:zinc-finger domain-containing protein [Halalkalibacter sp. APA_J-10(15)]|uniref:zinc-finger domain-containing protein n=1 Tax=Halalkalibacter sp. APA_J-10(15) TaxID=2933805 RepID=UPI001FF63DAD|nr:zinc-finger domain-containing protein [Halalkalibacter sp. APA_J-10(15)]MCK0471427.1 zinc-finger domain-containing protein [Halalkalibacter sp. APA_J-10(15)]